MDKIPSHRVAMEPRSGDTHVIGDDGEAQNIDQAARAALAKAAAQEAAEKPRPKRKRAAPKKAPATVGEPLQPATESNPPSGGLPLAD